MFIILEVYTEWKTIFQLVLIKTDDFIFLLLFLLIFVNVRHVSIEAMGIQASSDINGKYTISWNTNIFDICLETYWTARLWNWAPLTVINWWHICCPFEGMAFQALGFDIDYHLFWFVRCYLLCWLIQTEHNSNISSTFKLFHTLMLDLKDKLSCCIYFVWIQCSKYTSFLSSMPIKVRWT